MDTGIIIALITSGAGILMGVINIIRSAKKDEVDALSKIIDKVSRENERLRSILKVQEEKINALEKKLRLWKRHADDSRREIIKLGGCPPDFPERDK
jgi:bacterioferritin (cytochrome b1)